MGSAKRRQDGRVLAEVQPQRLKLDDPLAQIHGTSSIISFETDVLPQLVITEVSYLIETRLGWTAEVRFLEISPPATSSRHRPYQATGYGSQSS